MDKREYILALAQHAAQAHGYRGLNIRDLADAVGIRAATIYHYFPSKAALGSAVARRYREGAASDLDALRAESPDASSALRAYPEIFRRSLERENHLCLGSFMSAENDDVPDPVRAEMKTFGDVNVSWLTAMIEEAGMASSTDDAKAHARGIFASVAGAQLMARGRSDLNLFDSLMQTYQTVGLLPS